MKPSEIAEMMKVRLRCHGRDVATRIGRSAKAKKESEEQMRRERE